MSTNANANDPSGATATQNAPGENEFECTQCGASFDTKMGLVAHGKAHSKRASPRGTTTDGDLSSQDLVDLQSERTQTELATTRAKRLKALKEIDTLNPHTGAIETSIAQLIQLQTLKLLGINMGEEGASPRAQSTSSGSSETQKLHEENQRLRDQLQAKQFEDLKKETQESIQGLQFYLKKSTEDAEKERERDRKHSLEMEQLRLQIAQVSTQSHGSADERLISITADRLIGKEGSLVDAYAKIAGMGGISLPGQFGQLGGRPTLAGPVTSPQQAAADLARRLQQGTIGGSNMAAAESVSRDG